MKEETNISINFEPDCDFLSSLADFSMGELYKEAWKTKE